MSDESKYKVGVVVTPRKRRDLLSVTHRVRSAVCVIGVTLKVSASLLCGCLQMTTRQTMQSRAKITHGTTTAAWPASSAVRQLARRMHSTVMKRAAGETRRRHGL